MGIEYAEELHSVALENARVAQTRGLLIEPIFGDAGDFEFPAGPLVVNFANPFLEPVMERVIANLASSYETEPRPVVVVYHEWYEEPERTKTRNLELLEQVPFLTGRRLVPQRFLDRKLLQGHVVGIFESPEVKRPDSS